MAADPKPRARVKNPELLEEMSRKPCQVTGALIGVAWSGNTDVDTHHLVKHPRHDEPGNLFRLLHSLHLEFEQGTRRMAVAALIRAFMTREQIDYVIREKGEEWLDRTYPRVEGRGDPGGGGSVVGGRSGHSLPDSGDDRGAAA